MANENVGALSVVITATDRATATIDRVRDRLGTTVEPARQLSAAFGRLGEASGLARVHAGLTAAAGSALSMARNVATAAIPLAGGGLAAGASMAATQFISSGRQILSASRQLNMSVENLHAFQNGARLAGVSAEDATEGLKGFGQVLYDAVGGRNMEAAAAAAIPRIGFALRDASGRARTAQDALGDLADSIARLNDAPREQQQLARVWGVENLLPVLRRGRASVAELVREGRSMGVITRDQAEQAKRLNDEWNRLRLTGDILAITVGGTMAPALQRAATRTNDWTRANGEWLATNIVTRLEQMGRGSWTVVSAIDKAVVSTIGWERATVVLEALLAAKLLKTLTGINAAALALSVTRLPPWALALLGAGGLVVGNALLDRRALHDEARQSAEDREAGRTGWKIGGRPAGEVLGNAWQGVRSFFGFGSGGGSTAGTGRGASGAPTEAQREAFEHFRRMGWSPEAATGIVANGVHESGPNLDPRAIGDNGASYGSFQWNRRAGRQDEFRRWAGKDIRESTAAEQREFLNYEMTQGSDASLRLAGQALRQARTAAEAARVMSLKNMRPAGRYGEAVARGATAEGLLPQLNRPATPATPSASTPAPSPAAPVVVPSPMDGPRADRGGRVQVDVAFSNAPRNMRAAVRPEGNIDAAPPRIETAMQGADLG
ncbi:phage tail tip lysozyme [Roseomonas xinghualingensis]|uniref:phage tail tip lysozyme n=1 Tax=Roseomonas xinghualingensis TaxID=2986475 RepID=UPI0021F0E00B|nr:phage tail tip lysozyme [Roseomonas sp. SXEYE001]MCV4207573.1 phage tail tip lysozyme [Roseomonas sp. SXEYE001]